MDKIRYRIEGPRKPRKKCRGDLEKKLKEVGIKCACNEQNLINIITSAQENIEGIKLFTETDEKGNVNYWFQYLKWTRISLEYIDNLAEGVIVLKELGLI